MRKHELLRVCEAARKNYGKYPNVVGISAGTKFKKKQATNCVEAIQFYVQKKPKSSEKISGLLPKFVFGRDKNGRVNHGKRFPTDVIKVGRVSLACGAGSEIDGDHRGTMTIIFRNKDINDLKNYYVVTCAHVMGDFSRSKPIIEEMESDCRAGLTPFAEPIVNSTSQGGIVDYDIGLGRINSSISPKPKNLAVSGEGVSIQEFLDKGNIIPNMPVRCIGALSGTLSGSVRSHEGSVFAEFQGSNYTIKNVFSMTARIKKGDSGGLVYDDNVGVGIIVASSPDGWTWFQPLADAFKYLQVLSLNEGIAIKAFN